MDIIWACTSGSYFCVQNQQPPTPLTLGRVQGLHVDLVHLLGVVLLLAPLALAGRGALVGFLLQQVPRAVVDGHDVAGNLLRRWEILRGGRELEFAQDLSPDGFYSLLHELIHVQRAARG